MSLRDEHVRDRLTAISWVGGLFLLALFLVALALADPEPEPYQEPDYAIGLGVSNQAVKHRSVDAGNVSRNLDRLATLPTRHQEYVERQQAKRQERREARKQARIEQALEQAPSATTPVTSQGVTKETDPPSGGLPSLLVTIRAHESGGNYQAYNAGGCEGWGCGGAYQMHLRYAPAWAARYGEGQWAGTAPQNWPPAVQDKVALGLFWSTNPAGYHWCHWATYC